MGTVLLLWPLGPSPEPVLVSPTDHSVTQAGPSWVPSSSSNPAPCAHSAGPRPPLLASASVRSGSACSCHRSPACVQSQRAGPAAMIVTDNRENDGFPAEEAAAVPGRDETEASASPVTSSRPLRPCLQSRVG